MTNKMLRDTMRYINSRFQERSVSMKVSHPLDPIYDENSRILILGSFPSVRSREENFYYGHPQNRFWKLLARLYGETELKTPDEKKAFLLKHGIALWDVIASCEIENSADGSIRNASVNDLSEIFKAADIQAVFTNGKTADKLFRKYHGRETICLPSTSPANAAWSIEKLERKWSVITEKSLV